ncbi:hypothetical protein MNBD_GAMMA18-1397, partial [hydrothermal vent metagenome]
FTMWAKLVGTPGFTRVSLDFYDDYGYTINYNDVVVTSSSYQEYVNITQVPSGAATMKVSIYTYGTNGTVQIDNASLIISDFGTVGDGVGLLQNTGFESGYSSWNTTGVVRLDLANARNGNYALRLSSGYAHVYQQRAATAGQQYNFTGWYKMSGDVASPTVSVSFYDTAWNYLNTVSTELAYSTAYQPFMVSGIAPNQTAYMEVRIVKQGSGRLFVDDLNLAEELASDNIDSNNILENDDFEDGTYYWQATGNQTSLQIASESPTDDNSLQIPGLATPSGAAQTRLGEGTTAYTLSGWYKISSPADHQATIYLQFLDANDNIIQQTMLDMFSTNSWQQFDLYTQSPQGATKVRVELQHSSCGSCTLLVDDLKLTSNS